MEVAIYRGVNLIGEAEIQQPIPPNFTFDGDQIKIDRISDRHIRYHPLAFVLTLTPFLLRCKLRVAANQPRLQDFHARLLERNETAVIKADHEELHLVALRSQEGLFGFWCCRIPDGLYDQCHTLLNHSRLPLVLDLDETLLTSSTVERFDKEIHVLSRKNLNDEVEKYLYWKNLLVQYRDFDKVDYCGTEVLAMPECSPNISRPVVRVADKDVVFTRIKPKDRKTSHLVRIRNNWDQFKEYLRNGGNKRFDVYVCTASKRDYALEMWRLLDPDGQLIEADHFHDHIICIEKDSKKSFRKVSHRSLALAIDDRIDVWHDDDFLHVHKIPSFSPFAPVEMASPRLDKATNIVASIRSEFFRKFKEFSNNVDALRYESQVEHLQAPPNIKDTLHAQEKLLATNGYPSATNLSMLHKHLELLLNWVAFCS